MQQFGLFLAVRAQHRLDRRVQCAGDFQHLAGVEGIWCGDYQHAGAGDVGLDQHRRLGGIAADGEDVVGAQFLDLFAVLLDDDVADAPLGEQGGNALADAAVADQHDLAGQMRLIGAHRQFGQRIVAVLEATGERRVGAQPGLERSDGGEDQ